MPKHNRETLKKHFRNGERPTMAAFGDLIESMLNIFDDGIDYTLEHGLQVRQRQDGGRLQSFYDDIDQHSPIWSIGLAPLSNNLQIGPGGARSSLITLDRRPLAAPGSAAPWAGNDGALPGLDEEAGPARMGINQPEPAFALDVGGTIAAAGRIGAKGAKAVPANGQWHPILDDLEGCNAFEVMAGAGKEHSGKYALMHAFALNVFNSRHHQIDYRLARHDSKCNRIELKWRPASSGKARRYDLCMRVCCSYGEQVWIQYYVTQLWFDPLMQGCAVAPPGDGADGPGAAP